MTFSKESLGWYHGLIRYTENPGGYDVLVKEGTIREQMRRIEGKNLLLAKDLQSLLMVLNRGEIPTIILKGAYLANNIYPAGLRPVGDIDIMICQENWDYVIMHLEELGYSLSLKGLPLWMHKELAGKVSCVKVQNTYPPLDIHIKLGPYPYLGRIGPQYLWSQTERVIIQGCNTLVLRPELFLIHLCLHLHHHFHENWLVSSCDIAAVLRFYGEDFDWNIFLQGVLANNLQVPVQFSLLQTSTRFGLIYPDKVLAALNKKQGLVQGLVFKESTVAGKGDFDKYLLQFLTTPGLVVKIRCLLTFLIPSPGFIKEGTGIDSTKKVYSMLLYYLRLIKTFKRFLLTGIGKKY